MSEPEWRVRELQGEEVDQFYLLATETFGRTERLEERAAANRRRDDEGGQGVQPSRRRGVVDGNQVLGGYMIHERVMCIGPARVRTACIAAVVTRSEARGCGVGRALMSNAVEYARAQDFALLLLDGIPDFYHRFGFVSVLDSMSQAIDRRAIPGERPEGYRVRPVEVEDAEAVLALYEGQFERHGGRFTWTVDQVLDRLAYEREWGRAPMVAEDASARVRGYLYARPGSSDAGEVTADEWPALLAFLQWQAPWAIVPPGRPPGLWWRLPDGGRTFYLLANHLQLPAREEGDRHPAIVHVNAWVRPYAGWMARPAHLPALVRALAPLWDERWLRSYRPYHGRLGMEIGGERFSLVLSDRGVEANSDAGERVDVRLSRQTFTQLVFGYRPVWWIAEQEGEEIAGKAAAALEILFPPGGFWIAETDAF